MSSPIQCIKKLAAISLCISSVLMAALSQAQADESGALAVHEALPQGKLLGHFDRIRKTPQDNIVYL